MRRVRFKSSVDGVENELSDNDEVLRHDDYDAGGDHDDGGYAYASDGDLLYDEYESPLPTRSNAGRTIALVSAVVALVGVLSIVIWLLGTPSQSSVSTAGLTTAPRVGSLAPDFELVDVRTNRPLRLSSLRGEPVFMNFWGTWCPPCRAEMPEMQQLYGKYKDQLQIIGISMGPRDEPAGVKAFVDAGKYGWTFIHDADYNVATAYQVGAIPSSYFINKDGVIQAIHIGAMNLSQMETYFQKLR